jgi:asparagine synthase (glutamine-hydrolysing)
MSAMAGLWRASAEPGVVAGDCGRMLQAQALYGPHGLSQWNSGDSEGSGNDLAVSLGRRLFRTLPEDRFDTGPVALPGGGRLAADVRLDNRDELRVTLGLDPARARTMSDAALLAGAWSRWGEACFDRLLGDYAFAVWDAARRRLVLARDPFGRRPLFLHRSAGLVAFASMPAGLHVLDEAPAKPDFARLAGFLALERDEGMGALFAGIEQVEPGGLVVLRPGEVEARRHYAPSPGETRLSGPGAYAEALREHLDRAVGARLRGADCGVGTHLSSGWDSAAVTATAARLLAPAGGRVTAFTAAPRAGYHGPAPPGRHVDETLGAAEAAAPYDNIDHLVIRADGRSPLADLDRDAAVNGRPTLNPCNHLWLNDINRAARARGLTVLLTGDFGNLGLTDDGTDRLGDLATHRRWRAWWVLARAGVASGALSWPGVLAASLGERLPAALTRRLRRLAGRAAADPGHHSALRRELWAARPKRPRLTDDWAGGRLRALTHMDLAPYGKGALGAFGVDLRDPLTDRRLLEFCWSIPPEQLAAGGRLRGLARLTLSDRLSADFLARPTRGYQGADWHDALTADRASVVRDIERLAGLPAAAALLDVDRMRRLAADWPEAGWETDETLDAYRGALLRGLAVGRFITHTLRTNG